MWKPLAICCRIFLSVCILSTHAYGAPGDDGQELEDNTYSRPKIGLVLSGGGARGAAHVGVLKVLEELHVPVDVIAGTSFGAIVGGLYASGYTANELEEILRGIDWQESLSSQAPRRQRSFRRKEDDEGFLIKLKIGIKDGTLRLPTSLISSNNLQLTLRDLVSPAADAENFDDLVIPFRAVATNLETGMAVVLDRGDLTSAMVASMAVPALFPPVERDGELLVDGGVSNNVPVDVVRAMGADIVIAVDISTPLLTKDDLSSLTQVVDQLTLILTNRSTVAQLATLTTEDIVIRPDLEGIGTIDFERAIEALPKGVASARKVSDQLRKIALPLESWRVHFAAHRSDGAAEPVIDFVRVDNETEISDEVITSRLSLQPGDKLDVRKMSKDLTEIHGLELFEDVTYRVVNEDSRIGIEVRARRPQNGESNLRFGLALQDNFEGDSGFQLAAGYLNPALNSLGGEWRVLVSLGGTLGLSSEFYQPIDPAGQFFGYANAAARRLNVKSVDNRGRFLNEVRVSEAAWQVGAGMNFGQWASARIGLERSYARIKGRVGFPQDFSINVDSTKLAAEFSIDTLDSVLFPLSGMTLDIEYENSVPWLKGDDRVDKLSVGVFVPVTWGRNTLGVISRLGTSFNGTPNETDLFSFGGFLNMTAYTPGQLTGNHGGNASVLYYRRVSGGPRYLAQTPIYLGAVMETGNLWNRRADMSFKDLRWSSSIFAGADTLVGPVYLGVGIGDGGQTSAFLFIGQLF